MFQSWWLRTVRRTPANAAESSVACESATATVPACSGVAGVASPARPAALAEGRGKASPTAACSPRVSANARC
jgi:hypothetical protein